MNGTIYYTVDEIVKITKGKLVNHNNNFSSPTQLSLDSRKIIAPADTIFFAIKTLHHDGNIFIENLYAKGVRNFITNDKKIDTRNISLANVIIVKDSVAALQALAVYHRNEFKNLNVIGITGSNGKTIVKEWLNQLLVHKDSNGEKDFLIVRSPKSYNSQIGVPLSVLNIIEHDKLAIFEAGISLPDEMHHLEKMIKPTIGIFTNIGNAHDEGFENIAQKINEKLKLFVHARRLIYCADVSEIKNAVVIFQKKLMLRSILLNYFHGAMTIVMIFKFYQYIE